MAGQGLARLVEPNRRSAPEQPRPSFGKRADNPQAAPRHVDNLRPPPTERLANEQAELAIGRIALVSDEVSPARIDGCQGNFPLVIDSRRMASAEPLAALGRENEQLSYDHP